MALLPILALTQMGAQIGSGYFAGRDQQKYQEQAKRAQAKANLVNILGGGRYHAQPNIGPPQPGLGSQLMSGIGKAAGIGQTALGLKNALAQQETAQRAAETAQSAADLKLQAAQGQAMYQDLGPGAMEGTQGVQEDIARWGGGKPTWEAQPTSSKPLGQAVPSGVRTGFKEARSAAQSAAREAELDRLNLAGKKLGVQQQWKDLAAEPEAEIGLEDFVTNYATNMAARYEGAPWGSEQEQDLVSAIGPNHPEVPQALAIGESAYRNAVTEMAPEVDESELGWQLGWTNPNADPQELAQANNIGPAGFRPLVEAQQAALEMGKLDLSDAQKQKISKLVFMTDQLQVAAKDLEEKDLKLGRIAGRVEAVKNALTNEEYADKDTQNFLLRVKNIADILARDRTGARIGIEEFAMYFTEFFGSSLSNPDATARKLKLWQDMFMAEAQSIVNTGAYLQDYRVDEPFNPFAIGDMGSQGLQSGREPQTMTRGGLIDILGQSGTQ